jgi:hypothetical protein
MSQSLTGVSSMEIFAIREEFIVESGSVGIII